MYTVYTKTTKTYHPGDFHASMHLFENREDAEAYIEGLYLKPGEFVRLAELVTKKEYLMIKSPILV